jgi:hypothetical protein
MRLLLMYPSEITARAEWGNFRPAHAEHCKFSNNLSVKWGGGAEMVMFGSARTVSEAHRYAGHQFDMVLLHGSFSEFIAEYLYNLVRGVNNPIP